MAGKAPGTCSSELPPLDPRDDTEPVQDSYGILKKYYGRQQVFSLSDGRTILL